VELLVPLTWPLEIEDNAMKRNHHRHVPYLRLAQVEYKRSILHHDVTKILKTVIELAVPYMLMPKSERAAHDEGVIRLALFLFRNVLLIEQPKDLPSDGNEIEVSRSATIEAFHSQGVLQMISAIASSIGEEYVVQDVLVLELLFHILKGIDPEKLFMEEEQVIKSSVNEFKDLVQKEKSLLSSYKRYAPSRHGRFGTLVSLNNGEGERKTVSGQEVIHSIDRAISHMDKHKKWNKPKYRAKRDPDKERDSMDFNKSVTLSPAARKHLKRFVGDFLDSSFNPLFSHCRKAIEREDERVTTENSMHFFYLIGWFLKAECARRQYRQTQQSKKGKEREGAAASTQEDFGFSLVASVLNQETFVLLNRYMETAKDNKEWKELNAGMICFTHILLTTQQMSASNIEDDQEIAENIQNRIFYEESTHDRVIQLLRNYNDQGFGYLDACTELAYTFIRMLESYSKQNADLQIRSRRRQRKKQKAAEASNGEAVSNDHGEDANDVEQIQIVSRERKFDFHRFIARFLTQRSVDTFVAFVRYYQDFSKEQLKRAHRFFHRVAFKNELSMLLFRVDIIKLFHQMVEGPDGLDQDASYFNEWHDLSKQLFRRLTKKLDERPSLVVELLFSKIPATIFYLEHGYDNVVQKTPRPPAELEVRPGMEWDQQIGVAVSVLINQSEFDALAWIKKQLAEARDERQTWQDAEEARRALSAEQENVASEREGADADEARPSTEEEEGKPLPPSILVRPDNDERRKAMFKDNKLRLLMKLAGFERLGDPDNQEASWVIPSTVTADKLSETFDLIGKFEFDPPTYEDGKHPEDFLRSMAAAAKAAERKVRTAVFDDDSDGAIDYDENLDVGEYGAGGPTTRKSDDTEELKKKRRLKKRRITEEGEETDEETRARREAKAEKRRLKKMAEKQKFKSTVYVHDSDDEDDEERDQEFFAAEEQRRNNAGRNTAKVIAKAEKEQARTSTGKKGKKRKSVSSDASAPEDEEDPQTRKKAKKTSLSNDPDDDIVAISSDSSSSDDDRDVESPKKDDIEMTDTPISSQVQGDSPDAEDTAGATSKLGADISMRDVVYDKEEEDEDDAPPIRSTARRRGGFVIESDDED
jgi:replication fork protection complex subunit Tof1/Swi1